MHNLYSSVQSSSGSLSRECEVTRYGKGEIASSMRHSGEVFFSALGCLMLGMLLYTILTYGSPFNKEILKPWLIATLIDFYINVAILSVWVCYKEPNWYTTSIWILLLICFGSIVTCGYIVWQLLLLSSHDPVHLVLLNKHQRAESRYETTSATG
ncbi:DNA mismatch repair protein Msh6 [Bienertia sinuspersici]